MGKTTLRLCGSVITVAVLGGCAENPDAAQIVQRSLAVNALDWKAQPGYSHRECDRKAGQSKCYQILMVDGSPYSRLIEISGQPLTPAQEQQEQAKLNREIDRRRHESPSDRQARISKYESNRAEQHMLMQQMAAAFHFSLRGEEMIDGVDSYVLDATPDPGYRPPIEKARVLLGMRGRLWIDKEHYHWVRVQAEVINPVEFGCFVAKVKPGTKFELRQARVGDVWLPKHFSESVNASVFGVYGMHSREEELYSDYEPVQASAAKFTSIAASARIAAPH
ncbi:MAG: hypothetical protein JO211_06895 [Acidobacteriaceae bacterium]|nr:hypothetical protein [Acidobacteriaceae bacterium]